MSAPFAFKYVSGSATRSPSFSQKEQVGKGGNSIGHPQFTTP
jgi:hypothetical protein